MTSSYMMIWKVKAMYELVKCRIEYKPLNLGGSEFPIGRMEFKISAEGESACY